MSTQDGSDDTTDEGVRAGVLQRPLTLAALVAELRTALGDPDQPAAVRRAAASQLARLAAAGVPGAIRTSGGACASLSDDRPLVDGRRPVRVSPSAVESALGAACAGCWSGMVAVDPAAAKQGVGNLVHAAAMLAEDPGGPLTPTPFVAYVADRFDAIELAARWLGQRERDRAEDGGQAAELAGRQPRRLLAIEKAFESKLPPDPDPRCRGWC